MCAQLENGATLADLDEKKISDFVALARTKRGFKLEYTGDIDTVIAIANLFGLTDEDVLEVAVCQSEELAYICQTFKLEVA